MKYLTIMMAEEGLRVGCLERQRCVGVAVGGILL